MAQRIDDAMVEVITKMNTITEHLRAHDFVDSANKIARNVHEVINAFTDAVVMLNDDQMIIPNMKPKTTTAGPQVQSAPPKQTSNGHGNGLALYSDMARKAPAPKAAQTSAQAPRPQATRVSLTRANAYGVQRTGDTIIATQLNPIVPVNHPPIIDSDEEMAAIITVRGTFKRQSLNFLTSKIHEGPLFGVEINYAEKYAEITFQKAVHAVAFLTQERAKRARTDTGMFGADYKIISAAEFDWNSEFQKMEEKPRERRRLTIARAGLLGGGLSVKKILGDMAQVVGTEAIEFIWAFNAGNVTVVFNSVSTARAIRDHFLALAKQKGNLYYDTQITFSTDPCEKQLNLECQFGVPQYHRTMVHAKGKKKYYDSGPPLK